MPLLSIDTETFSTVDIDCGLSRYWEAARVLCIAWKLDAGPIGVSRWDPDRAGLWTCPAPLAAALSDPAVVVSGWNVAFDWMALDWFSRVHGWPVVPFSRTSCTMVRAAMGALPQRLSQAAPIIHPHMAKDGAGSALMLKMCKPGPVPKGFASGYLTGVKGKAERKKAQAKAAREWYARPESAAPAAPHTSANLSALAAYCMRDVECEWTAARSPQLPEVPPAEEATRQLDRTINARGVQLDIPLARGMAAILAPYREELETELRALTGGKIETATQTVALRNWLEAAGAPLPNLQSETVEDAIADGQLNGMDPNILRVLQIRGSLALASLSKIDTALANVCKDGRLRDMLRFYRATTGRWAGAGFQPQNIPRPWFGRKCAAFAIERIKAGDADSLRLAFDFDLPWVISSCLRGLFIAPPGKALVGADFAQIEARVLNWAAGEERIVEAFSKGGKIYEMMAAAIFGIPIGAVGKDSRERHVGKTTELGAGYQMGERAFRRQLWKQARIAMDAAEAQRVITAYRDTHPHVVRFWYALDEAAICAVKNPGGVYTAGPAAFHCEAGRWLRMRLPSGRCLYYQKPSVIYDEKYRKDGVRFWGVDRYTHKWAEQRGYGGFWAENFTQAASRDLMVAGMHAAEAAGFPLILTVHDEELSEVEEARADVKAYERCMTDHAPAWAKGIPLKAEGWTANRYHK